MSHFASFYLRHENCWMWVVVMAAAEAEMRKRLWESKCFGVQRECVARQIMTNHTMQFKSGDSLSSDWIGRNFELVQSAFSCTGVRFLNQHSDLRAVETKLSWFTACFQLCSSMNKFLPGMLITLPEAQRTQGIASFTWVISPAKN